MPHLTLQYTDNIRPRIDFKRLFSKLHEIVAETGSILIGNCKSRAMALEEYLVARGGSQQGFVHLDVAILEGRSDDVKQAMGARCLDVLEQSFAPEGLELQITVEIRDILRGAYFKSPEGTLTHS